VDGVPYQRPEDVKTQEGKQNCVQDERRMVLYMIQLAVLRIAVEVNGDKDKGRDASEEWNSTEKVIVISVEAFLVIGLQLPVECHYYALVIMETMEFGFGINIRGSTRNQGSKNRNAA
jgi:hypothetical protein